MSGLHDASVALLALMISACATDWDRSYSRWYDLMSEPGPYMRWAHCIRDRSSFYLTPESRPADGSHSQLFTYVLADCRAFMTGNAWRDLSDKQRRQLIDDAFRDFHRTDLDIQGGMEESVI